MSNLKMPDMNFAALWESLPHNNEWKKIAYKTWARATKLDPVTGQIDIKHHDTVIATIQGNPDIGLARVIELSNGGYVSATTTNRLNAITVANTIPGRGIYVCRKNGKQMFLYEATLNTSQWCDQGNAVILP